MPHDRETAALAGRYALRERLGAGGLGVVQRARDLRLGRDVAVKVLRRDLAANPDARRCFQEEAQAAARLHHPGIVTVLDAGEDGETAFLVMEELPGPTLADEMAAGPLTAERTRAVGHELLDALEAAHAAGVVHRDLKPGNVLLTRDGRAKLGDFGIARTVDDVDAAAAASMLGTAAYLAPERLAGASATPATDLYALGVVLYEAVTGTRPYEGDTPGAVAHALDTSWPWPVRTLAPHADPRLAHTIEQAIDPHPAHRFDSVAAMRAALGEETADETVAMGADATGAGAAGLGLAGAGAVGSTAGRTVGAVAAVDVDGSGPAGDRRRRGRVLAGAGVGGLALAGLVLLGAMTGRSDDTSERRGSERTSATADAAGDATTTGPAGSGVGGGAAAPGAAPDTESSSGSSGAGGTRGAAADRRDGRGTTAPSAPTPGTGAGPGAAPAGTAAGPGGASPTARPDPTTARPGTTAARPGTAAAPTTRPPTTTARPAPTAAPTTRPPTTTARPAPTAPPTTRPPATTTVAPTTAAPTDDDGPGQGNGRGNANGRGNGNGNGNGWRD